MKFQVNENLYYAENPQVQKNRYLHMKAETTPLPEFETIRDQLPIPVWDGHEDAVRCYDKTWQLAFGNLKPANDETGFVSNYIDTAFNSHLFMWDSSFILMFGKYASRIFNFQKTLDNFYSHQHKDGFICREIFELERGEQFSRDDPTSTGPNIMPWAEWEYFCSTGDMDRLESVFDPLCAYYRWLQLHRSWPDGSYWSSGWACGMDNQPRVDAQYDCIAHHGFMSWIDACAQQYFSAGILCRMAAVLGRSDEVHWLEEEQDMLRRTINDTMWSEQDQYYYDKRRDGSLNGVKSIGAYWTLLADLVPEERKDAFVAHLDNENEFKRPNRVPTLSYDHPDYDGQNGGYWCGAIWAPTNYMVLSALGKHGYHAMAHEIARTCHEHVVKVFNETGTVFENYAPERVAGLCTPDFVGWTGLIPIAVLFEYIFGIKPDSMNRRVTWRVNLTERHGIRQYPLGDATVDLICEARNSADEKPVIKVVSDKPVTVEVIWNDCVEEIRA